MSVGRPSGSSRALRLDPFALPVRYAARDGGADGQIRQIELDRDRVVLRRAVRGIRMNVGVPVSAFRGVAVSAPKQRRRRRSAVKWRHSRFLMRRKVGRPSAEPAVHHGEREIIARN